MSEFSDLIDEIIGEGDALDDIRLTVRRCWFYDFDGYPLRIWQGQGLLHSSDANEWLGTVDADGRDLHTFPSIQDGRDGSSATYTMTLNLIDIPGQTAMQAYDALKSEQWRVNKRKVTCYLVLFQPYEGLRPATPIAYFKDFVMFSPKFSEKIAMDSAGRLIKTYSVSVSCKDGNYGRSNVPGNTYSDTVQKEYAKSKGVALDRGCEFVAALANRTYQIP